MLCYLILLEFVFRCRLWIWSVGFFYGVEVFMIVVVCCEVVFGVCVEI